MGWKALGARAQLSIRPSIARSLGHLLVAALVALVRAGRTLKSKKRLLQYYRLDQGETQGWEMNFNELLPLVWKLCHRNYILITNKKKVRWDCYNIISLTGDERWITMRYCIQFTNYVIEIALIRVKVRRDCYNIINLTRADRWRGWEMNCSQFENHVIEIALIQVKVRRDCYNVTNLTYALQLTTYSKSLMLCKKVYN